MFSKLRSMAAAGVAATFMMVAGHSYAKTAPAPVGTLPLSQPAPLPPGDTTQLPASPFEVQHGGWTASQRYAGDNQRVVIYVAGGKMDQKTMPPLKVAEKIATWMKNKGVTPVIFIDPTGGGAKGGYEGDYIKTTLFKPDGEAYCIVKYHDLEDNLKPSEALEAIESGDFVKETNAAFSKLKSKKPSASTTSSTSTAASPASSF